MYPKARIEALTDGVFAVAMTLLVLDIRLPEDFHPHSSWDFAGALAALWPKFLPYALSFGVLGMRWLANVALRTHEETFGRTYARWWLLYLLLITCVPFSTIVVGRYDDFAPAVWLYIGHTVVIAMVGARLRALTPGLAPAADADRRDGGRLVLGLSALLAFAITFVNPRAALLALVLNLLPSSLLQRARGKA